MKKALIKLHIAIFLAGTSGLFGKWVSLNETALVWYRVLLSLLILGLTLAATGRFKKLPLDHLWRIGSAGVILVAHWLFFYASIKAANVSVGVVCLSAVAFITALIEPIFSKEACFSWKDILLSIISVLGIVCIFSFDSQYRLGIIYGIISSTLVALLMIANKQLRTLKIRTPKGFEKSEFEGKRYSAWFLLFVELCCGFFALSIFILVSTFLTNGLSLGETWISLALNYSPTPTDWTYLAVLAAVVTITPYALKIDALKYISAFTVNLANNMVPVYSISLAARFFNELEELNLSFFIGLGLIALSVILQTLTIKR